MVVRRAVGDGDGGTVGDCTVGDDGADGDGVVVGDEVDVVADGVGGADRATSTSAGVGVSDAIWTLSVSPHDRNVTAARMQASAPNAARRVSSMTPRV